MKNNITNTFLPYELSKEAKELGFDEECLGFYDKGNFYFNDGFDDGCTEEDYSINSELTKYLVASPTYDQIQEWLIEKYIYVSAYTILNTIVSPPVMGFIPEIKTMDEDYDDPFDVDDFTTNHKEALTAAIKQSFKIIRS